MKHSNSSYYDTSNWGDAERLAGGVKLVPVDTPNGQFHVWTKRVGNNPDLKVLFLHGGPGATTEYFECFDVWFPAEGIEYHYYDQLGSLRSDQPDDPSLWNLDRFTDEVEQVRTALGMNRDNFVLMGQSWGGLLAIEYALRYPDNLKALAIMNMMSSCTAYNAYAQQVLMPAMDPEALRQIQQLESEGRIDDPRYDELLNEHHNAHHLCRLPIDEWPDPVVRTLAHINPNIYVPMQGPSELGMRGSLETWDRSADLHQIDVPTLVVGAEHDTMDPAHMRWMAQQLPQGSYLHCPNGSHLPMYDDPEHFFPGVLQFLAQL